MNDSPICNTYQKEKMNTQKSNVRRNIQFMIMTQLYGYNRYQQLKESV